MGTMDVYSFRHEDIDAARAAVESAIRPHLFDGRAILRTVGIRVMACRHFAILSSLTLGSLTVASFGLSLMLWSRLRVLRRELKPEVCEPKND